MNRFCTFVSPTNHDTEASASQDIYLAPLRAAFTPAFKKAGLSVLVVYAANQTEVLIGCGGGDGGAGSNSIFRVDLSNGVIQEKAFCFSAAGGKYMQLCYNQNGQIYYQSTFSTLSLN